MESTCEQKAAEVRVRAERKVGELLAQTEKHKGGRPVKENQSPDTTSKLADLGISKDQSSKWQKLAEIPKEKSRKSSLSSLEPKDQRSTFEEYCRQRWSMTRRHANRLIESSTIAGQLGPIGPSPVNESQLRPLASLEPEDQSTAFRLRAFIEKKALSME